RHPPKRGYEVAARGREDADYAAMAAAMDVVGRPAVVPEHDLARLGERRDGAREAARVRAGEEVDALLVEQHLDRVPDLGALAPVVPHEERDARFLRPQLEAAAGSGAHRCERSRERNGQS